MMAWLHKQSLIGLPWYTERFKKHYCDSDIYTYAFVFFQRGTVLFFSLGTEHENVS